MTNKIRVLIAENNIGISSTLKMELLKYPDIKILGLAKDGVEALDLLKKTTPDVIVLDIIMPRLDGIEVLEKLSKEEEKYKIIIYSAISNQNIINKAISLGADYYIIKSDSSAIGDVKNIATKIKILTSNSTLINENFDRSLFYEEKTKLKSKNDIIQEISYMLQKAGIPPHIKGYQYLRMCIYEAMVNIEILSAITKELYPKVASRYSTTSSGVERAIRHSLEIAWGKGNVISMFKNENIFYNEDTGKPTNKEFILLLSEKLRLNNI